MATCQKDNLEKLHSVSFDWKEFEKVFACDLNNPDRSEHLQVRLLSEVSKLMSKYLRSEIEGKTKVLDFHQPHQLREILDHCLNVDDNPRDVEQLLSDCKETLKYCVKTAHPRYLNHCTGIDLIGVIGEWITAASNTNMFDYESAPVFTLMEVVILKRMREMIGWQDGDGLFSPGGAISNLYAMLAARHALCPDIKETGNLQGVRFAVFTSEHGHFSIKKSAVLLGIGLNNVFSIKTDKRGRMCPDALDNQLRQCRADGYTLLMVNATCGTSVLGAYDPVSVITDVCHKHNVWLHIDNEKLTCFARTMCPRTTNGRTLFLHSTQILANIRNTGSTLFITLGAWGGSVLFSAKHRHLVTGVQRADSMTWNPHKMMGVPLQCSAIFLKQKGLLAAANQLGADYLYQKENVYDTMYDTGDKAIQCGRHNDIFKLWLMWRSKGDKGFEVQIDRHFEIARYLLEQLKKRADFELVLDEIEGPNVCFWFVPKNIKQIKETRDRNFQLHKFTSKLKALMMEKGSLMIQYQPLAELPNFFRIAVSNPQLTTADMDFVIREIVDIASQLE